MRAILGTVVVLTDNFEAAGLDVPANGCPVPGKVLDDIDQPCLCAELIEAISEGMTYCVIRPWDVNGVHYHPSHAVKQLRSK